MLYSNLPTGIIVASQKLIYALSIAIFALGPYSYLEIEASNNCSILYFFHGCEEVLISPFS